MTIHRIPSIDFLSLQDPNAPKRGASAYMLWLKDNRSRITKPGMSVIDVSKQAGVEWNAVKVLYSFHGLE